MHKLQNCKQKKGLQGNQIYLHNNDTKEEEEHNMSEKKQFIKFLKMLEDKVQKP